MIFHATAIHDAWIVELEKLEDARGFFARAFCSAELAACGVQFIPLQANLSHSRWRGTIRGMHWQDDHAPEAKFIRCVRGAVHDVIVDLRPDSPTYLRQVSTSLSADNGRAIHVPHGCAHGHQSLSHHAQLLYLMNAPYTPGHERGARHDDPALAIRWPLPVTNIHSRDLAWPPLPQ